MNTPDFGPEPPFPGFDQYEGDLRYSSHAVRDRMLKDGHTDADVRMVLASPMSIRSSRNPEHPYRIVVDGICSGGYVLRVIVEHDGMGCKFLFISSVYSIDVKPVRIKVPARRVWSLWLALDGLKGMAAVVKMGRPKRDGSAIVTISDPMPAFRDDAVHEVESIISMEGEGATS